MGGMKRVRNGENERVKKLGQTGGGGGRKVRLEHSRYGTEKMSRDNKTKVCYLDIYPSLMVVLFGFYNGRHTIL
jgi:hypothetical protein